MCVEIWVITLLLIPVPSFFPSWEFSFSSSVHFLLSLLALIVSSRRIMRRERREQIAPSNFPSLSVLDLPLASFSSLQCKDKRGSCFFAFVGRNGLAILSLAFAKRDAKKYSQWNPADFQEETRSYDLIKGSPYVGKMDRGRENASWCPTRDLGRKSISHFPSENAGLNSSQTDGTWCKLRSVEKRVKASRRKFGVWIQISWDWREARKWKKTWRSKKTNVQFFPVLSTADQK